MIDTHCHIHDEQYGFAEDIVHTTRSNGVEKLICVGVDAFNSQKAVEYASRFPGFCYASVGIHPHDAMIGEDDVELLYSLATASQVVAIGECGLDYYYNNSPKDVQKETFTQQIELAMSVNLPLIFHIRDPKSHDFKSVGEAFCDFFSIIDNYPGIRGVVHSFSADARTLEEVEKRGLYVGVNGIVSFTANTDQTEAYRQINIARLLLETDAPYLTPTPLRGKVNVPANVRLVAACLAELRGDPLEKLIEATTTNARTLFAI